MTVILWKNLSSDKFFGPSFERLQRVKRTTFTSTFSGAALVEIDVF